MAQVICTQSSVLLSNHIWISAQSGHSEVPGWEEMTPAEGRKVFSSLTELFDDGRAAITDIASVLRSKFAERVNH